MPTLLQLGLLLLAAEVTRRCVFAVLGAFTGPLSKIPGPFWYKITPLPWMMLNLTGESMNVFPGMVEKYGPVVRMGPRDILFADKASVQRILVEEDFVKSPIYEGLRLKKSVTSLITETDKVAYKQKRRLLSPGFAISYLNALEPVMKDCINVFEKHLNGLCEKAGGRAVVDMSRVLGNLTSDVMSATSFGGSFNLVSSEDTRLKNLVLDHLKRVAIDAQFPFINNILPRSSAGARLYKMIDEITEKRRADKGEKKRDLLQIFVDTNDANPVEFTDLHLKEEMILFMIAGSDTTSATATFTLLLLLNNQEKLEKLKAEIDAAFPSKDSDITIARTQDLAYLNAVINESMRVMPIVPVGLARWTTETTIIAGYEIPPETVVAPAIGAVMKNPEIWPDAQKFIPERWLGPYKGVEADRKAFVPFSAGSRNCIGQQFALKELRLILTTLILRYELSLIPGQSHKMKVHTVPWFTQGFYNVGLKPRV